MDMPEKESDVVHSFLSRLTQSTEPNWERLLAEGARLMYARKINNKIIIIS